MNRPVARQLVRVGALGRWFPYGVSEVVAHTDDRMLSVSLTRHLDGRGMVSMQEFSCDDFEQCARAVRAWLHGLGLAFEPDEQLLESWATDVARDIVDSLPRHPAAATVST